MWRFLLVVGLVCSFSQAQDSYFDLVKLTDQPAAVCNDGSPAAVYYSPSQSCGGRQWIVHLQGGYWCWDDDSCTDRAETQPYYVSSNGYASTMTRNSGIFSRNITKNPDFYGYNYVYVMYCSSDQFAGDGTATINNETWQFRGKDIVNGVINHFITEYGMNKAEEILWSGCSAGGQGVLNTIDQAADLLAQNGFAGKFKGMADAGWMSQFVPITSNIPMGAQLAEGFSLWNGSLTECVASNPGFEYLCYLSQFGSSHLKTPTLFQCEQYDLFQTGYNCCNPPFTSENFVYLDMMRDAYQHSFKVLGEENGVFSAACYWHCSTEDDTFNTIQIDYNGDNLSLQQVLGNFYHKEENRGPTHVVDYCDGYQCSVGCPPSPTSLKN